MDRNTQLAGKQLPSEAGILSRVTDSPRLFHVIILNCEIIIIDNPTLHSIPLTGRDMEEHKNRFTDDAKRKRVLATPRG